MLGTGPGGTHLGIFPDNGGPPGKNEQGDFINV